MKKGFCKNIHFERGLEWSGVNRMIIHFSKASIPPSIRSSIHPFLKIILALNNQSSIQFRPPTSSDDLCLLFCLILILLYMGIGQYRLLGDLQTVQQYWHIFAPGSAWQIQSSSLANPVIQLPVIQLGQFQSSSLANPVIQLGQSSHPPWPIQSSSLATFHKPVRINRRSQHSRPGSHEDLLIRVRDHPKIVHICSVPLVYGNKANFQEREIRIQYLNFSVVLSQENIFTTLNSLSIVHQFINIFTPFFVEFVVVNRHCSCGEKKKPFDSPALPKGGSFYTCTRPPNSFQDPSSSLRTGKKCKIFFEIHNSFCCLSFIKKNSAYSFTKVQKLLLLPIISLFFVRFLAVRLHLFLTTHD